MTAATPTLAAVTLLLALAPGAAGAGEGVTWRFGIGAGYERLGYQEHLDPTTADSVVTPCRVDGEDTTCFIDSDAGPQNLALDVEARVEWARGFLVGGTAQVGLLRAAVTERWTAAPNQGGSPGPRGTLQTDHFEYRWFRFDVFGGYRILDLLQPFAGARLSLVEQARTDFRDASGQPLPIGQAIEPVESTALLLGVLGERETSSAVYGYLVRVLLPFEVTTTNSLIAGEFTDVGGYAVEGGGSVGVPVRPDLLVRVAVTGGVMHWEGSAVQSIAGGGVAKWPENDTQLVRVTAGFELVR